MLTETQKQAARMLFEQRDHVQDIAAIIGVHRCTLWRWTKRRDFRKELRRHKRNEAKRIARLREKMAAEMEQRLDAAEQEWKSKIEKCTENVRKEAELSGNHPSEGLIDAEMALSNAMSADPFRGVFPGLKKQRRSHTDQWSIIS